MHKNFKKLIMAFVVFGAIFGMVAPVSANGVLYVGTADTNSAVTYDSVQEAVNNASANDTIHVAPGTYNESVEVTTDNLTIQNYNSSAGNVTIDATNQKYGEAFYGGESQNLSIGSNVLVDENVVYVNTSESENYDTVQEAVNNTVDNSTLRINPGTYNESLNVTSNHVRFANYNFSEGNVVLDATETNHSSVFRGEYKDNVSVGHKVTVKGNVWAIGGGGLGDIAGSTYFGVPMWAYLVVLVIGGYIYMEQDN